MPELARERERLVGERSAVVTVVLVDELARLHGEQARPPVRIVVELECPLDRAEAPVVDLAVGAHLPARVGQRRARCPFPVAERFGDPGRVQQRVAIPRVAGEPLRFAKADERLEPVGRLVGTEELERLGDRFAASLGARLSGAWRPARIAYMAAFALADTVASRQCSARSARRSSASAPSSASSASAIRPWVSVAFHSAHWRHDHDLRGRDVLVLPSATESPGVPGLSQRAREDSNL